MKKNLCMIVGLLCAVGAFSQDSWSLTGNAGTTNANFVGTTDNIPLIFKASNQHAGFTGNWENYNVTFGFLSFNPFNGANNTAIGAQALSSNSSGVGNVAIGTWAMDFHTTGSNNVAIGESAAAKQEGSVSRTVAIGRAALFHNTKNDNTAIGFEAGLGNTTGEMLTAVGYQALRGNSEGSQNTAVGFLALRENSTGLNNTAVGSHALHLNTTGHSNTGIGMKSLFWNSTGEFNTAIGSQSMEFNTTGNFNAGISSGALHSNTSGYWNTAVGTSALWNNRTGSENTAVGGEALAGNFDGHHNTAVGTRALWSTENVPPSGAIHYGQGSGNTAVGFEALREITTGNHNVGVGMHALRVNSTGRENVSLGSFSMYHNATGSNNAAIGNGSLNNNTTGEYNTAIGNYALTTNITGNYNTVIGYNANVSESNFSNATAIGYGAIATASNQVTIGNSSVTSIRAYAPLTTISDGRVKKNIQDNVPGLDFIKRLRPVTYNLDLDAADNLLRSGIASDSVLPLIDKQERNMIQDQLRTGFIAQDVEEAANSIGYEFSGLDLSENVNGLYGLRYSKFIVPLVRAIQELSEENEEKNATITALESRIDQLQVLVNTLLEESNSSHVYTRTITIPKGTIEQNFPNPFNLSTMVRYTLAQKSASAQIVITTTSGRVVRQMPLPLSEEGQIMIDSASLPTGMYFYSLYVNHTLVDTKKMIVTN